MESGPDPATAPKRFALRLSVRMSMGLVLLVGVWLGWVVRRADRQRQAVAAIEKAGGRVYYDWQYTGGTIAGAYLQGGRPWAPRRLVNLLGPDYFGTVISVQFKGCGTDEILAEVSRLEGLEQLSLFMSGNTDEGMGRIAGLVRLRELSLQDTAVGDAGLRHLESLPRLRELALPNRVTDAALVRLAGMAALRAVNIHREHCCPLLTEAGVRGLRKARPDLIIDPE